MRDNNQTSRDSEPIRNIRRIEMPSEIKRRRDYDIILSGCAGILMAFLTAAIVMELSNSPVFACVSMLILLVITYMACVQIDNEYKKGKKK